MEKTDILAIGLCIAIIIFTIYIAYLKEGINFCIEIIASQQNAIEGLIKALENNNALFDKQCEWNNNQIDINKAQLKFNSDIEKSIKANNVNHSSPTGGCRSEAEATHTQVSNPIFCTQKISKVKR